MSLRLSIVNHVAPPAAGPEELLEALRALTGWASAVSEAGAEVAVFQAFSSDHSLRREGVRYELVAEPSFRRLRAWHRPRRLHRRVAAAGADVVHMNGLLFALQARDLRRRLEEGTSLVLQHHAEAPRGGPAGRVEKWALGAADAFLFSGRATAAPWRGALRPRQAVFEIMEGSSLFRPPVDGNPEAARRRTGLRGSPVLFWAGHLDENKDPLTVLEGFELALRRLPGARLYMAFLGDGLLPEVKRRLAASRTLTGAVTLLGRLPYTEMEACFQSADLFVQGSHHEGSGFALVDAMACGVVPVVTDIPSFRFMTGGAVGHLWPPGDAEAFTEALVGAAAGDLDAARRDVRELFDRRLSWTAIGRRALDAYQQLRERRRRGTWRHPWGQLEERRGRE